MDKYKKYDEDLDIFPDVSIEPIESITGAESEEEYEETTPQVRREQEDIFATSIGNKQNKKIEKQPTIAEEEESEIINDEPDKMETVEPKRKGRGKAIKKYNTKPRTEKQLAVLEKARLARARKRELKAGIKMEISPKQEIKEEKTEQPLETVPTVMKEKQEKKIPKNINDFDTFCDFMNRYNTNRQQMGTANSEAHPNKLVKKNLLPRPPLIANEKNKVEKIKKKVAIMEKPTNIYDPMYAINMLTNRGSSRSKFKDPFSR
jgi:hypothetical protein